MGMFNAERPMANGIAMHKGMRVRGLPSHVRVCRVSFVRSLNQTHEKDHRE